MVGLKMISHRRCFIIGTWDRAGTCLMRSSCLLIIHSEVSIVPSSPSTFLLLIIIYHSSIILYFTFLY